MAKYCENCGAKWDDDVLICGNCGAPFAETQETEDESAFDEKERRGSTNILRALIILGLIIGIIISLWSLVSFLRSGHEETISSEGTVVVSEETKSPTNDSSSDLEVPTSSLCVVIDPGHQRNGNPELEPIGPGATEMKAKVTGGTTGRYTGVPEYVLNLQIGLQLKEELEERGYRVIMTRETHDVNLSNQERAQIAAESDGDIFVRIHANGSDDPTAEGAMTICMTENSPYHPELYPASYALSESILDQLVESTECRREYVWETDTMSGINWATIPVSIVEVGYMTNENEDMKLSSEDYQHLIVLGIANGIDYYFHNLSNEQ